ncbi:putative gustatory receptor 28b [Hyposmocoma kahamanoa]|uniref:putative gustatory receptor 28b n=1 Tax=Hyposmocoma kahamanoa TaxID=1477025 RepID=UPI000E6D647A|nr:putative gustatory receptor 28b [Hyposmocoma kahamanoa]
MTIVTGLRTKDCGALYEKQSQDKKTFSIKRSRPKCSLDSSLVLTLRISRLFGVAPVSFEKQGHSIFVKVSPGMYAYSNLLLFVLHTGIISGVVLDFYVDPERCVRVRSAIASLMWLTELVVVCVLMTFGVYNGPGRMNLKVLCLYLCFYLEFMATFPLELQFMVIVMKIVSAQKAINNALMDLVCQVDNRGQTGCITCQISNQDTELVRYLILSYGAICDVVRQINDSNAIVLNLLLLSFFLHLVVNPYYLISFWASTKHWEASAMLQIFMFSFHTLNMMIIIEPAHRSTEEMEATQALLGQLTRRVTNPSEPLFHELDLFYKQIVLNPVSFTPMGICSLTRPIITTIFGAVTTYIVIILQFKALDKQSW